MLKTVARAPKASPVRRTGRVERRSDGLVEFFEFTEEAWDDLLHVPG
jgi:hypothetical protein